MPKIAARHLRALLASVADQPVVYVSIDSGAPVLEVFPEAYVNHDAIVTRRSEVVDAARGNPYPWALEELIVELQEKIDQIVEDMKDAGAI